MIVDTLIPMLVITLPISTIAIYLNRATPHMLTQPQSRYRPLFIREEMVAGPSINLAPTITIEIDGRYFKDPHGRCSCSSTISDNY